ncbi:MAG: hypothetical protein WCK49_03480 [Myxococcaceae bacterium]
MKIGFVCFFLLSPVLTAQQLQIDPNGSFSIVIPNALLPCDLGPGSLACPTGNPALTITVSNVAAGASVELMALNAEDAIHKKPNFKVIKKEIISVDSNKTIVQTMTFNNLGNVALPVLVRTVDSVLGTKAFELQVACNQSTCGGLLDAFDEAIASLHLAQSGHKLKQAKTSSMDGMQNWLKGFKF